MSFLAVSTGKIQHGLAAIEKNGADRQQRRREDSARSDSSTSGSPGRAVPLTMRLGQWYGSITVGYPLQTFNGKYFICMLCDSSISDCSWTTHIVVFDRHLPPGTVVQSTGMSRPYHLRSGKFDQCPRCDAPIFACSSQWLVSLRRSVVRHCRCQWSTRMSTLPSISSEPTYDYPFTYRR
jgi:hypothetical protein